MFSEIGPLTINSDGEVVSREETSNWNQHYGLLFLDNPCGVGYSFSADESGYVTNETQVGSDLYSAIAQFYQLFPDLRNNDFYITGESYAGKYIPAAAYTIFTRNPTASHDFQIPLKGISIGDGAMDPPAQFQNYGSLLWYMGMIDVNERLVFNEYEAKMQKQLSVGDNLGAFNTFDEMLNGDFIFPTYYYNVTGLTNYFNMEEGDCGDCQPDYTDAWLDTTETRNKIHVGDLAYNSFNDTVEVYLKDDWMMGVTDFLLPLLNSKTFKVLVYSGQNDVILGAPLTEQFFDKFEWDGKADLLRAPKDIWTVDLIEDDPIAGYMKHVKDYSFTYAVVRGAGHMVPLDQSERAYDMITQFVNSDFE
jgi:vitellogenic carboxypeptidase-like protein